jgi:hypothetical protein
MYSKTDRMNKIGDCLICFQKTKTYRINIEPTVCECKYFIHKHCYNRWIATGTQRLCLICNAQAPVFFEQEDEFEHQYFGMVIIHPMAFQNHLFCMNAVTFIFFLFVSFVILLIAKDMYLYQLKQENQK